MNSAVTLDKGKGKASSKGKNGVSKRHYAETRIDSDIDGVVYTVDENENDSDGDFDCSQKR